MAKLLDKTPKNLFGIGYKRVRPISLAHLNNSYSIIGINLPESHPCLYTHEIENISPEVIIAKYDDVFYIGDVSIILFHNHDSLSYSYLNKKHFFKRNSIALENILNSDFFKIRFNKRIGDLSFEKKYYGQQKKLWTDDASGLVDVGFNEWEIKFNYFINNFLQPSKLKETLANLFKENCVHHLQKGDIISFPQGFCLKFRD